MVSAPSVASSNTICFRAGELSACLPPDPEQHWERMPPKHVSRVVLLNIQHPTSNAQHPMNGQLRGIGCSVLAVGCWMFGYRGASNPKAWARIGALTLRPGRARQSSARRDCQLARSGCSRRRARSDAPYLRLVYGKGREMPHSKRFAPQGSPCKPPRVRTQEKPFSQRDRNVP
jgi:hypothetical protein